MLLSSALYEVGLLEEAEFKSLKNGFNCKTLPNYYMLILLIILMIFLIRGKDAVYLANTFHDL